MSVITKQQKAAIKSYATFQIEWKSVLKQQKKLEQALRAYKSALDALAAQTAKAELLLDSEIKEADDGQEQLLNATRQMQETQMSFNLQYLQLQSRMQSENRSYTAVSNIMKTKHDTVKNSIANIR